MNEEQEIINRLSGTVQREEVEKLYNVYQKRYEKIVEKILEPYTTNDSDEPLKVAQVKPQLAEIFLILDSLEKLLGIKK